MYQYPNPINDFYFRNAQLAQNGNNPLIPNMQPQTPQLICRYVTNEQEAKAAMVDALTTYVFVDIGSGKIYLKKMSNNGLSDFYTYVIDESNIPAAKADPITEINNRLSNIENYLGAMKDDKSFSGNDNATESAGTSKAAVTGKSAANGAVKSGAVSESA